MWNLRTQSKSQKGGEGSQTDRHTLIKVERETSTEGLDRRLDNGWCDKILEPLVIYIHFILTLHSFDKISYTWSQSTERSLRKNKQKQNER